ncbi:glycosyltransferase [Gramella sp. AN32]|uniref:Glycosyltransferase family 2 protein n=1 Tax=Christiangramia antarctica TaxID=2058158 RepID=A0ABW5X3G8_9FLAO|nr:glycosyltransferase [Gramella sp. AN32]MCM4154966.1 hypothetical protein [Gramella sp. AN32]
MNSQYNFSLITIVKGRQKHLQNLLEGVKRNSLQPKEIIIVTIDENFQLQQYKDLNIKTFRLEAASENIPLGEARNFGAGKAVHEHLIFLDVDCIPSEDFFEKIITQGSHVETLIMGTPRYLTKMVSVETPKKELLSLSHEHPARPKVPKLTTTKDYMLFWSLAFYIPSGLFFELGGFDEDYKGYGAEDSDFGLKLQNSGKDFYLSEAIVFHQQHAVYSPPVHQLDPIINNAQTFQKKWGRWVMENWLDDFQKLGLIEWDRKSKKIYKLKNASGEFIKKCFKPDAPYM